MKSWSLWILRSYSLYVPLAQNPPRKSTAAGTASEQGAGERNQGSTVLPARVTLPNPPSASRGAARRAAPRSHALFQHIPNTPLGRTRPGRGFKSCLLPSEGDFCDLSHHFL